MAEYKIRLGGDDYWKVFQLCRIRLAYLWRLRATLAEPWSQQDLETFLLHARLLLEQIALFFREAAIDREKMSRTALNSYTPDKILRPYLDALRLIRFVTFKRLVLAPQPDGLDIDARYGPIVLPDVDRMASLYGRTNNFLHVTAKAPEEGYAVQVMNDFFAFFAEVSPLFDRHAIERQAEPSGAPPNLAMFEIIVGREDRTNRDEFWECNIGVWKSRLITLAERTES